MEKREKKVARSPRTMNEEVSTDNERDLYTKKKMVNFERRKGRKGIPSGDDAHSIAKETGGYKVTPHTGLQGENLRGRVGKKKKFNSLALHHC